MIRSRVALRFLRTSHTPAIAVRPRIALLPRSHLLYTPITSIRAASHSASQPADTPAPPPADPGTKAVADEKIEEITELFYTAQDEFEIAMEETEKVSVYAEEDRKAAREEFDKMNEAYKAVIEGSDAGLAEEVKRRIGQRIRELEQGVKAMEEMALNQD